MKSKLLKLLLALSMVFSMVLSFSTSKTKVHADDTSYLTFTAQEDGAEMSFDYDQGTDVMINKNGTGWVEYTKNETITFETTGEYVQFQGQNVTTNADHHFNISNGNIAGSGDVTSLVNGTGGDCALTQRSCFSYMFSDCTALTASPALPSTTLCNRCYESMFAGCTGLLETPTLPATKLYPYCYKYMFTNCTSLIVPATLPAKTLAKYCYYGMFQDCDILFTTSSSTTTTWSIPSDVTIDTSLTDPDDPEIYTWIQYDLITGEQTIITNDSPCCYDNMFSGCSVDLMYSDGLSVTPGKIFYIGVDHKYVFSADNEGFVVKCTSHSDCDYAQEQKLAVTDQTAQYTGLPVEYYAYNIFEHLSWFFNFGDPTVEYYQGDTKLESAPTDIGVYTVKLTYGNATIERKFTIAGDTTHTWEYSNTDTAITAKCTKTTESHEDGHCQYADGISLTIPTLTYLYTGKKVEFIVGTEEELEAWDAAGLLSTYVTYYQGETELDNAPSEIGDYTAKVSFFIASEGTFEFSFSIVADEEHAWEYSLGDEAISAACTKTDVSHENGACTYLNGLSLTVTDPTCLYTGDAVAFSVGTADEQSAWTAAGLELPTVEYYQGETKLDAAPSEIGSYVAKVTMGDVTKEYAYSINADPEHAWTYAITDDAVAVKCTKTTAAHEYGECEYLEGISLTITDPTCLYTGDAVAFSVGTADEQSAWTAAGLELPTVEYYMGKTKLDAAPSGVGCYSAKVAVGNVSKEYEFEINSDPDHTWVYEFTDDAVTVKCTKTTAAHEYGECEYLEGISLTVTDPTCIYTGEKVELTVGTAKERAVWEAAGLELPTVTYYNAEGQEIDPPAEVGKYEAVVAVGEKEYSYDFSISKAVYDYEGTTEYTLNIYSGNTGTLELDALPEGWTYGTPEYTSTVKSAVLEDTTLTCQLKSLLSSKSGTVTIPVIGDANHADSSITISVSKATPVSLAKCTVTVSQSVTGAVDVTVTDPNGNVVDSSCYTVKITGTLKAGKTVYVKVTGITSKGYSSSKTTKFKVVM